MNTSTNSFKTDKSDTQSVRQAAEAELQNAKAMSVGNLKKKDNPRVLKPLPTGNSETK